jgi:hypothetical protein
MNEDSLRYALIAVVGVLWAIVVAFSFSRGEWLPTYVLVAMTATFLPVRQVLLFKRRRQIRRAGWPEADSGWS